ncbi:hypothetical protein RFI_19983 [Reticulomyxa filosa]|uniref:Uncharacterized protein n=1 Tax=Reticulomyxa filosa TaxID=46433 RepID=X6MU32_RETFI|nr:hypothetical protein RFI_19983 [Reticulomyxa filosa]|eukprot:ETO17339.1 hypothetical protein RFI_19983 [Reticulomyxa filosa]
MHCGKFFYFYSLFIFERKKIDGKIFGKRLGKLLEKEGEMILKRGREVRKFCLRKIKKNEKIKKKYKKRYKKREKENDKVMKIKREDGQICGGFWSNIVIKKRNLEDNEENDEDKEKIVLDLFKKQL